MAAKKTRIKIRMVSEAGTGYTYTKYKNPRNTTEKLRLKMFDPIARKHCYFDEKKIK